MSIKSAKHPLDPLSSEELERVVALTRDHDDIGPDARFVFVTLLEPTKQEIYSLIGKTPERRAHVVVHDRVRELTHELVVSLSENAIANVKVVHDVQPAITIEESRRMDQACKRDPRFLDALQRRGLDVELVSIDAESIGGFAPRGLESRRLAWGTVWARANPEDNRYAKPVSGLVPIVDLNRDEVIDVEDHGSVPVPPEDGRFDAETIGQTRPGLRPLDIQQSEGPSFEVDGWQVRWQGWQLRVGFDAREGLVLHDVRITRDGELRPVLFRASFPEMVVPYGDPGPTSYRKAFFDWGEYGAGQFTNSLELGCDCLGVIRYLDVPFVRPVGEVSVIRNAICMHEEDFGVLWKHTDTRANASHVRRSRRLVISSFHTVANYDYGFFWYLYQDGRIEAEVKLTGILSVSGLANGEEATFGREVAPGVNTTNHQHFFNARLDLAIDGPDNSVCRVEASPLQDSGRNPHGNAYLDTVTPLRTEVEAQDVINPLTHRHWRIVNPSSRNRMGEPRGYRLLAGDNVQLLASPSSSLARRAGFLDRHVWVTPFAADERYPAGDYPNQGEGNDGLSVWTSQDRLVENTDIVLWYTFGSHHTPRPEDWPVMPVARIGFALEPDGFFDRNPALDVPEPDLCHKPADAGQGALASGPDVGCH